MKGIKFYLKNGTVDYYDPLEEDDFAEYEDAFVLDMNYQYEIPKDTVESFEWYDLCEKCGFELYKDGCKTYNCK